MIPFLLHRELGHVALDLRATVDMYVPVRGGDHMHVATFRRVGLGESCPLFNIRFPRSLLG